MSKHVAVTYAINLYVCVWLNHKIKSGYIPLYAFALAPKILCLREIGYNSTATLKLWTASFEYHCSVLRHQIMSNIYAPVHRVGGAHSLPGIDNGPAGVKKNWDDCGESATWRSKSIFTYRFFQSFSKYLTDRMLYRNVSLSFHDYWLWHILTLQNRVTFHVLIIKMSAVCFNSVLQIFLLPSELKPILLPYTGCPGENVPEFGRTFLS